MDMAARKSSMSGITRDLFCFVLEEAVFLAFDLAGAALRTGCLLEGEGFAP